VSSTPRSLTIIAKAASLGPVTELVRQGALEANLPQARIGELELMMEELFTNVCKHAYADGMPGDVTVSYSVPAPGELRVEVADHGVEFNPLKTEPPDLSLSLEKRPIGGLGIHLVKTLARSLSYRREQGCNRLTFVISAGS